MPDTRILVFLVPFSVLLAVAMYYGGWAALRDWLAKLETPIQVSELEAYAPLLAHCTRITPGESWGNAVQFEFNDPPQHAIIYRTPTHANRRVEYVEVHVPWRAPLYLSFVNGILIHCLAGRHGHVVSAHVTVDTIRCADELLQRVRTLAARAWK